MPKAMVVHGGAWDIPDGLVPAHREACTSALDVGWEVLEGGGSSLDAVERALMALEDHPDLDAGVGAFLNAEGEVELDAGLMDGGTLAAGSVAAVQRVRHPITLARRVMESDHVLLVGQGAERFAERNGVERCPPAFFVVPREIERWKAIAADSGFHIRRAFTHACDTVGAVALDGQGHIAAGTSTGGTPFKLAGRVGDSPLVGSGFYADDRNGGASCTGWGEGIMRVVLAKSAVDRMAEMDAPSAAQWAVNELAVRVSGLGGIILLDTSGRVGYAYNTPRMAYAYRAEGQAEAVFGI